MSIGYNAGGRIAKAREALILFLRSLPAGCKFSVISFGSDSQDLTINGQTIIDYNEENSQAAIQQIEKFGANLGGTDIATPLLMTISMEDPNLKKRIFCLTDGAVSNPDEVVELAKTDSIVVHTVGIGDGCDTNMLARTAKEGRGTYSQIGDGESDSVLNGKVITAL